MDRGGGLGASSTSNCRRTPKLRRLSLWQSEEGAVSIYLIVSTAMMLLLTALLIDYARIAAFNKQSELAAQSGIRSALSAYDKKLYERYGLFGAGGSDRNLLFSQAAERNWQDGAGFSLLRIRREASHVDTYEFLGNHAVFTRQVLEEMKYKAPIDFTMEIVSRFSPMSTALKEASLTLETLEEVKKLYEEREKHLKQIIKLQERSAERTDKLESKLAAASAIISEYASYETWLEEDAELVKAGELPLYMYEIASYVGRSQQSVAALNNATAGERSRQAVDLEAARSELEAAEQLNAAIVSAAERIREAAEGNGFDNLSDADTGGRESSSMTEEEIAQFGNMRASVEKLVIQGDWFVRYRQELNDQLAAYDQIVSSVNTFQAAVSAAHTGAGGGSALDSAYGSLNDAFHSYVSRYAQPGTVLQTRRDEQRQRNAHDAERQSNENAAKSKWSQVKAMIGGMKSEPGQEKQREAFDEVKRLAADNLLFNQAATEEVTDGNESGQQEEAGDRAKSAMSSAGALFGGMADLLTSMRDPLYVNEYVAHRFQSFDPKKLNGIVSGTNREGFSEALSLDNQEMEYILYGLHEPGANVAAAFGEIFAARLAIRTMEGFITCRALGHPLLVLSAAVLYGLEQAIADMLLLTETGKVQLSKYVRVEMTYADYLRTFLILHGNGGEGRKARMIAVIERNTDTDLSTVATGLSGEMTSSVNLWFLPGLIRSFTAGGILNGKVKGGRYEKTQTIGTSYG